MASSDKSVMSAGLRPKSCAPCRKSKVKCDRRFPCGRCLRMRVPCEDTLTGEMEEPAAPLISIRHMVPTLTSSAGFDLCLSRYGPKDASTEKATVFMNVLAGVYRRKGGGCEKLRQEIEALAEGLEVDFNDVVRPRTDAEAEAERARLAGHFPFVLSSPELRPEQGLHPYALDVFSDPFISMGAAVAGGEQRVFVNAAWASSFFDEEAARQMLEGPEALRPVEMFGTLVHPDDRAFLVPLLDTCLFGCSDALAESTHIFRCHCPRTSASFLSLVRIRAVVAPEGYVCCAFSVQPLPFPADMVKLSLPAGSLVASRQPWQELMEQHERGEHTETANVTPVNGAGPVPSSGASVASSTPSLGSAGWGGRRQGRGSAGGAGRRGSGGGGGGRRSIVEGEEDEQEDEDDESGRESFRSSDAGRDSFYRYSDAASHYNYGEEEDDGGRDSIASEAARALAGCRLSDAGTPRSSLGEDRGSAASAAGVPYPGQFAVAAAAVQNPAPGGIGSGGEGAGMVGLRPPQVPAQQQPGEASGMEVANGNPPPEASAGGPGFFSRGKRG